jgi:histone deacetylase 6
VAILDWDIHDGNGTSEGTIQDDSIFRIDIHLFNGFYPCSGAPNGIGSGNARGLNLNMARRDGGMGNAEYAAASHELILPLLADFQPDLLLISYGLDARPWAIYWVDAI